jgi:hypothetical protein
MGSFARVTLGTALLFGAVVVATPMTSTAAGPKQQVAMKEKAGPSVDDAETRIKTLHRELKITPEQEQAWNAVAQQIRDNAKQRADAYAQQTASEKTATAPDMINAYAKTVDTQADAAHKFSEVFQPLYDSMSEQQKKTADAVFRNKVHAAAAKAKS